MSIQPTIFDGSSSIRNIVVSKQSSARFLLQVAGVLFFGWTTCVWADPCGMVPPLYSGDGAPIARIGEQITYVSYLDGVESIVIRPGFSGKVDQFGMLIPFPAPPALRKVPDQVFEHIAAAIDPPEVAVYVGEPDAEFVGGGGSGFGGGLGSLKVKRSSVRVLREEAVGMYEVAVLEAGSSEALKRWMDTNGFRYPNGMDSVCDEYIEKRWCFVAVKTSVASKSTADPQPGLRDVSPGIPADGSFDGHVQAMGFRFKSKELVVPMRLSAFNDGELRNIVYLLSDKPQRIRSIPEEYVVRQIAGAKLVKNITQPLPLRIIGGGVDDISPSQHKGLPARRDPHPKNGVAKDLFASDLIAAWSGELSLPHEETEKELLRIGERFRMRGIDIDRLHANELRDQRKAVAASALKRLRRLTLTVIDGDFSRDVLANDDLTFATYRMPAIRNKSIKYNAMLKGPNPKRNLEGKRIEGPLSAFEKDPSDPWFLGGLLFLPAYLVHRKRGLHRCHRLRLLGTKRNDP